MERNLLHGYFYPVQYAPELEKRCRPHLKATNDSWRVDETYINVKKVWMCFYRAVDSRGKHAGIFCSTPQEMRHSAKRFFSKALLRAVLLTVARQEQSAHRMERVLSAFALIQWSRV